MVRAHQDRRRRMSQISPYLRAAEGNHLLWWCPGCKMHHMIAYGDGPGPRWGWNGDEVKPTFTPSVLVRYNLWTPPATDPEVAAKIRAGEIVQTKIEHVCHLFVKDGQLEFLGDCTHELAGKTVPMVELRAEDDEPMEDADDAS